MNTKSRSKAIAIAFLSLLSALILVLLLVLSSLGVKLLVSIANDQDGISIEKPSGSFYGAVVFEKLDLEQDAISIKAQNLRLDISLRCLFAGEVCVDNLSADDIDITLKQSAEPSQPPESLKDYITLPVAASLDDLNIAHLRVSTQIIGSEPKPLLALQKLSMRISMFKQLIVHRLSIEQTNVFLANENSLEQTRDKHSALKTAEDWLNQLSQFEYKGITIEPPFIPINARIEKAMFDSLCIEQVDKLCTLQTILQASLIEQLVNVTLSTKPVEQIAESLDLTARVNLAPAFTHKATLIVLPNQSKTSSQAKALNLNLDGNISSTQLEIIEGSSNVSLANAKAFIGLTKDELPIELSLKLSEYLPELQAWLPEQNIPISNIQLRMSGNIQDYKITAKADVKSEQASQIKFDANVSVSEKRVVINTLNTSGDLGVFSTSAVAKLQDFDAQKGVYLDAKLAFDKLQLKPLAPTLDTQLNGKVNVKANISPTALWGELICENIEGRFQGYDLSVLCDININKSGLAQVKSFRLKQSDNLINAKGSVSLPYGLSLQKLSTINNQSEAKENSLNSISEQIKTALMLDIDLADLSIIHPNAAGKIIGNINVTGEALKPTVAVDINIQKLVFEEYSLQGGNLLLNTDLKNDIQSNLHLSLNKLTMVSDNASIELLQDFVLTGEGNIQQHVFEFNLQHPDYAFAHSFSGQLETQKATTAWRWQGTWLSGEFVSAFDTLRLNQQTAIDVQANTVLLDAHCWLSTFSQDESMQVDGKVQNGLCIKRAEYTHEQANIKANITYNLQKPLRHYFSEIVLPGTDLPLNTEIVASYSKARGIEADAFSQITQATVITHNHKIDLVAIIANISIQDQIVNTNIFAGTQTTGAIGFSSDLILAPNNRTHTGQLRINELILSPLQRFLPGVEKLDGMVDGSLSFAGLLTQPTVDGAINVADAELYLDNYPYPVTNFNQTLEVVANKASLAGDFELGAGDAQYRANLDFVDGLRAEGMLKGAGMQIAAGSNEIVASPNLSFSLSPENIDLKGEVLIPNAQIQVKELPQSAKSASKDTLIIGEPSPPPILPIGVNIDVRMVVDPAKLKRVTIDAFDLTASLGGDMRLRVLQERFENEDGFKPLETYVNGEVNILSGSYEAYGQNLQIQKGNIFFSGSPDLPQFDVRAIRNPLNTADNVIAGIRLSGNPVVPRVELFSEPTMIQARQLSYLLNGTDLGGSGQRSSNQMMLVNALVSFGVGNSENGVNKLGKSLGFDSLSLQTAGQGDSTQVQLTGRISDNVQVTYGVGVFDQASEVILKYQLLPKLYLEAKSGATSAVDLFYEVTRSEN